MKKIVPIGGAHRSAASMLAEVMDDDNLAKCVVVTIGKDGIPGWGHYGMVLAEMCWAAEIIRRMAFDEID